MVVEVEFAVCPFNPNHVLKKLRLPQHIMKCAKHFPNHVRCRYDATHYVLPEDIAAHEMECSEKFNSYSYSITFITCSHKNNED